MAKFVEDVENDEEVFIKAGDKIVQIKVTKEGQAKQQASKPKEVHETWGGLKSKYK